MALLVGFSNPILTRTTEGQRNYRMTALVMCESSEEGPLTVLSTTTGLPHPGDEWQFGTDVDAWAWCRSECEVTSVLKDEIHYYEIVYNFSTEPYKKCQDTPIENPLLQPIVMSIVWNSYVEEINRDRFGKPVVNSAHEQLKGSQIEFEKTFMTVRLDKNVRFLDIYTLSTMNDTVNASSMWGMPPRTIKFNLKGVDEKYYGQCIKYYTLHMEFEIRYEGFDRNILDEGTKVLHGKWDDTVVVSDMRQRVWKLGKIAGNDPDPKNPEHFDAYKDAEGNSTHLVLNGAGLPANVFLGTFGYFFVIKDKTKGGSLTDDSLWIQATGFKDDSPAPEEWASIDIDTVIDHFVQPNTPGRKYKKGALVEVTERIFWDQPITVNNQQGRRIFISLIDDNEVIPWQRKADGTIVQNAAAWCQLVPKPVDDTGENEKAGPFSLKFKGDYSAGATYNLGEYVRDANKTYAGNIHVESYRNTEFRLLGIPEVLGDF